MILFIAFIILLESFKIYLLLSLSAGPESFMLLFFTKSTYFYRCLLGLSLLFSRGPSGSFFVIESPYSSKNAFNLSP